MRLRVVKNLLDCGAVSVGVTVVVVSSRGVVAVLLPVVVVLS